MNILTAAINAFREHNPNISATHCMVFITIAEHDGQSLKVIREQTGLNQGSLQRALDALVGLELIERKKNERRRREVRVHLTEAGRQLVANLNGLFLDYANGYGKAVLNELCSHSESLAGDEQAQLCSDERYLYQSFGPKKQQLEDTVGKVIKHRAEQES